MVSKGSHPQMAIIYPDQWSGASFLGWSHFQTNSIRHDLLQTVADHHCGRSHQFLDELTSLVFFSKFGLGESSPVHLDLLMFSLKNKGKSTIEAGGIEPGNLWYFFKGVLKWANPRNEPLGLMFFFGVWEIQKHPMGSYMINISLIYGYIIYS